MGGRMNGLLIAVVMLGLLLFGCVENSPPTQSPPPVQPTPQCVGMAQDYCNGNTLFYGATCINGKWQYSEENCQYGCSNSVCMEASNFEIFNISYSCLYTRGASSIPAGGIGIIQEPNINGLTYSTSNGGITSLQIRRISSQNFPQGTWNIKLRVYKSDNTIYFESSGTFEQLNGLSFNDCADCLTPLIVGEAISAPYTKGGRLELEITSPDAITKTKTLPMPTEQCEISSLTSDQMVKMVQDNLDKNKIIFKVDPLYNYSTNSYSFVNRTPMTVSPTQIFPSCTDFFYQERGCVSYSGGAWTWSVEAINGLYYTISYYENVAPPYESTFLYQAMTDPRGNNTVSIIGNGNIKKLEFPLGDSYVNNYFFSCKNKAWISIKIFRNKMFDETNVLNAVRDISSSCAAS